MGPLIRGLLLLALLNTVLLNLALMTAQAISLPGFEAQSVGAWAKLDSAINHGAAFLAGSAGQDSWEPMRRALEYVHTPHEKTLYSKLFFGQGVKFQYPPTSLLLLEPLRALPVADPLSNFNLNAISWLAIVGTAGMVAWIFVVSLRHHLGISARGWKGTALYISLAVLFTFTYYPIVKAFTLGQIQVWSNFLFAATVLALIKQRPGTAGALSGLVCVIKPQFALLLVWALLRKRYRFMQGWAFTVVPIVLVSLLMYGLANHLDYLRVLSFISRHGEGFYSNQSVNGLLNRLLLNGNNAYWEATQFAPFNIWVYVGTLVSSVIIIGLALFWKRNEYKQAPITDFLVAALAFTIASPVAWEHHYGVMLPVLAVALPATLASPRLGQVGIATLVVAFVLSSNRFFFVDELAGTPFNFLQSYLLFGALLLLAHLYRLRQAQQYPEAWQSPRHI